MANLSKDLELVQELNENRRRAKDLREQAIYGLKRIGVEVVRDPQNDSNGNKKQPDQYRYVDTGGEAKEGAPTINFDRWVPATDEVEIALLVKVQNHRELSKDEENNNARIYASPTLEDVLTDLKFDRLLQQGGDASKSSTYPVLLAARAMQALVNRAKTAFAPATMRCYYRIIRELYGAAHPNWTVGAARAGVGGTTSAFVTNECIRAIFAFENALTRTYDFFKQTGIFYEYFCALAYKCPTQGIYKYKDPIEQCQPLRKWAEKSVEAMWLDCQLSTNPRNREMVLFRKAKDDIKENALLLSAPPSGQDTDSWVAHVGKYFDELRDTLAEAVRDLRANVEEVLSEIDEFREGEQPEKKGRRPTVEEKEAYEEKTKTFAATGKQREEQKGRKPSDEEQRAYEEKTSTFNRTATAHLFARKAIRDAQQRAEDLQGLISQKDISVVLTSMAQEFYTIRRRVHHVLEPSKQYLKWVIGRELAASPATFDAGELVFAATSFGAINNWGRSKWRLDDRLTRACESLILALADTGRLPTKRPFHANRHGYRTIPIGCEMTRALATLLQKTGYNFDVKFVDKMLGIFEEHIVELPESRAEPKLIGWNFEAAPDPDKPAAWVTAISVLALDRIVRMLNTRINEIVLAHFDITQPDRPHTSLHLRDLIYSDHALVQIGPRNKKELTAIHLQKARAHVMRATLPKEYRTKPNKNFSAIYYGPPQTGKTTLAEALALSAQVPLLRLSPGDLILQGGELIEGRAHDVFEALSMLTQCVIIFDEFDAVLQNRGNEAASSKRDTADPQYEFERIWRVLESIKEKDDPKFRFVVGGMLPKLIKLHDSARQQSFAYCLATNYLKRIDHAAKREGRFDQTIPVYWPDALSRAGALFYQLGRRRKFETPATAPQLVRFFEAVAGTIGEPADRISNLFQLKGHADEFAAGGVDIFDNAPFPTELKEPEKNLARLITKLDVEKESDAKNREINRQDESEADREEREWIIEYEGALCDALNTLNHKKDPSIEEVIRKLEKGLGPPLVGANGIVDSATTPKNSSASP
jgi:hypothetical protein